MFANRMDVDDYCRRYGSRSDTPNLGRLAHTLAALAEYADNNSDGWTYWKAPRAAAARILAALQVADVQWRNGREVRDLTDHETKRALIPVRTFLTRRGVAHEDVIA